MSNIEGNMPILNVDDLPEPPDLPGQHPIGYEILPASEAEIRAKILHVLAIFPRLSHSMLQVGIGTYNKPELWRVVLERLIDEGLVRKVSVRSTLPSGRDQVYTILMLSDHAIQHGSIDKPPTP